VVACKTFNRSKITNPVDYKNLYSEIEILESLDHPSIIGLYEKYEDMRNIHLIMEMGGNQNLKQFIKAKKEGKLKPQGTIC